METIIYSTLQFNIMDIKYTTIIVKDMGESVNFYKEVFGFEVEKELNMPDKQIKFLTGENGSGVELIKEEDTEIGLNAIAVSVDDVEKAIEEIKSKIPSAEVQIVEVPNGKLGFVQDPNGVTIAVSQK
ncbi:VOC family protein [Methanobrevibacter woesei]|uniref:VOC family protein n=1 Tax=Methanobrevibacter woesei TaxID=190976 RepID=UPI0023F1B656|nr:VOC family protein [Methanobrevibacter woesei]MCI7291072.1 VOC family protein [Methanobrevibacter woesei]